MVFYEKKRFVQTYPLVDELNLPMTEEEVSVVTDFIKACL